MTVDLKQKKGRSWLMGPKRQRRCRSTIGTGFTVKVNRRFECQTHQPSSRVSRLSQFFAIFNDTDLNVVDAGQRAEFALGITFMFAPQFQQAFTGQHTGHQPLIALCLCRYALERCWLAALGLLPIR